MQNVLSVSEINSYIKSIMANDLILTNLWVRGEISNYKNHSSGHMYFTVKDEYCLLKCVMFKTQNIGLDFVPKDGLKVLIRGYISVFERDGQYQLYVQQMQKDGLGKLHEAFLQLKEKLKEEGIFDDKNKKDIPLLPKKIGVVTSPTGAVLRDIINVLNRRYSNYNVVVFPVPVQGDGAAQKVSEAIAELNEKKIVDVIILARGGGSLEELWAFNEEIVARSIFGSKIPIISAIGHETDFTIADFVADLRAPTPSAAAEMVLPEKKIILEKLAYLRNRLKSQIRKDLQQRKDKLMRLKNSNVFKQPYNKLYQERMKLDVLNKYMQKSLKTSYEKNRTKFRVFAGKLDALSPLAVFSRGYGMARMKLTGEVIKSIAKVKSGDEIEIYIEDGKINCKTLSVESGEII